MSSNISEVLSTSSEIELGGKKYRIKSITLGDIGDFQKWCLRQKKAEILELYKMAEKEVDVKEIMQITGDEGYYDQMMNSLGGVIYLLHKAIHKSNDTDLTEEQLSDVLDTNNLEEIVNVLFGSFVEDKKTEKKTKAKSQQKK